MANSIWVIAEQWKGDLSEITYETLALGRELADGLGAPLEAVLLGQGIKPLCGKLGLADAVICADHASLAAPVPEAHAEALAELIEQRQPYAVLVPWTNVAADVLGLLPARLDAPFLNSCQDIRIEDGKLRARCILYGGKIEASVGAPSGPAIFGVLPGSRPADAGRGSAAPAVEEVTLSLPEAARVKFKAFIEPEAADVDITQQTVLISVGRGVQSADNVEIAQELAAALGGAVCGSRPVIDQGWLPLSRQVGKSGSIVKPKLYIAAGISGAPEHIEGMKSAELIIAINTDPGAPIFGVAHYGAEEDATDVLPALLDAVQARKG
jgi:electron transfer flavoprotein alpha subunit